MDFDPTWDKPRQTLYRLVTERGETFAEVSRAIDRNHAYLQQYLKRGNPAALGEVERVKLGRHFGVSPDEFRLVSKSPDILPNFDSPLLTTAIIAALVALTEGGKSLDDRSFSDIARTILRTYEGLTRHSSP